MSPSCASKSSSLGLGDRARPMMDTFFLFKRSDCCFCCELSTPAFEARTGGVDVTRLESLAEEPKFCVFCGFFRIEV